MKKFVSVEEYVEHELKWNEENKDVYEESYEGETEEVIRNGLEGIEVKEIRTFDENDDWDDGDVQGIVVDVSGNVYVMSYCGNCGMFVLDCYGVDDEEEKEYLLSVGR